MKILAFLAQLLSYNFQTAMYLVRLDSPCVLKELRNKTTNGINIIKLINIVAVFATIDFIVFFELFIKLQPPYFPWI